MLVLSSSKIKKLNYSFRKLSFYSCAQRHELRFKIWASFFFLSFSTRGEVVLGIVGGGATFGFLNRDAISDQNMPFFIRLYALVVPLKIIPDFRNQNHIGFRTKRAQKA